MIFGFLKSLWGNNRAVILSGFFSNNHSKEANRRSNDLKLRKVDCQKKKINRSAVGVGTI